MTVPTALLMVSSVAGSTSPRSASLVLAVGIAEHVAAVTAEPTCDFAADTAPAQPVRVSASAAWRREPGFASAW